MADKIATVGASEHKAVKEAMDEGLLQLHGTPPNSKQDGIFRILCENPNGLSNQITGNQKLDKAIDIKMNLAQTGYSSANTDSTSTTGITGTILSKCSSKR